MSSLHPEHDGMSPEGLMLLARTSEDSDEVARIGGTASEKKNEAPPATDLQKRWDETLLYAVARYTMLFELNPVTAHDWDADLETLSNPPEPEQNS